MINIGYSQSKCSISDPGYGYILRSAKWLNAGKMSVGLERKKGIYFFRSQAYYSLLQLKINATHDVSNGDGGPSGAFSSNSFSGDLDYNSSLYITGASGIIGLQIGNKHIKSFFGLGLSIEKVVGTRIKTATEKQEYSSSYYSPPTGYSTSSNEKIVDASQMIEINKKVRIYAPLVLGLRFKLSDLYYMDGSIQYQGHQISPVFKGYNFLDKRDFAIGISFLHVLKKHEKSQQKE